MVEEPNLEAQLLEVRTQPAQKYRRLTVPRDRDPGAWIALGCKTARFWPGRAREVAYLFFKETSTVMPGSRCRTTVRKARLRVGGHRFGRIVMKTRAHALTILSGAALVWASIAAAQTDSSSVQPYVLGPQSNYETGCFGPCLCAIRVEPLEGTFTLKFVGFDGLYDNYAVSDVRWAVPENSATIAIRGSGTYRIGGEVALLQELSLDLSIDGNAPRHFDSGLVTGADKFPKIDIQIAAQDTNTACVDTVMHVQAAPDPVTAAGTGSDVVTTRLGQVAPNPFAGQTKIQLSVAHSGPIELVIYDVLGRAVRHLARGAWLPAGSHRISWDGRRDSGARCAAGVYLVRARADGRCLVRRMIKVE